MPPLTNEQIDDMCTYHNDPSKVPNYEAINKATAEFIKVIVANSKPSADQSAAIRQARLARMLANSAIALDGRY